MVEYGGMLNHLYAKIEDLGLSSNDSVVQNAPQSFDISVWQYLAVLLVGGKVEVVRTEVAMDAGRFSRDLQLSGPTAAGSDYTNSGFSRAHMAPAADFAWSEAAIRSTFVLSNAVPLLQSVNAGPLARIESAVRRLAALENTEELPLESHPRPF